MNDFAEWADETRRLTAEFQAGFESRYGYPPGDHVISGPTDAGDHGGGSLPF